MNAMGKCDPWLKASNKVGRDLSKLPKLLGITFCVLSVLLGEKWVQRPTQSQHFFQRPRPRHLKQSSQHVHFSPGIGLQRAQSFITIQKDTRAIHSVLLHLLYAFNSSWVSLLPFRRVVSLVNMFSVRTNMKRRTGFAKSFIVTWNQKKKETNEIMWKLAPSRIFLHLYK